MYKTTVTPVSTHDSRVWVLWKADERVVGLFGIRVLRCILGAMQEGEMQPQII
jgi:hypothetical protein